MRREFICSIVICISIVQSLTAQQVPDLKFEPSIIDPKYASGKGPLVLIDEAHHNFHTIATRFHVFAKILQRDGYVVRANTFLFAPNSLQNASLLVIANAIHPTNESEWTLPTPSAFSSSEIEAVRSWVFGGGSLFLVADHMPFPGAAHDLAYAFGFSFYNGFATDTTTGLFPGAKRELDIFYKNDATLATHLITNGSSGFERVEQVATFTGQAFQIPDDAQSLLTFDDRYKILLPDTAWRFNKNTKRISVKGFSQGAVKKYGKGRVAVFGEAAMFTGQLKGQDKIPFGLNSPHAKENIQFLLNITHWLIPQNN